MKLNRLWTFTLLFLAVIAAAFFIPVHIGASGAIGMCLLGVVIGDDLDFGVAADQASLTAQRTSMSGKIDVTEARDKTGKVIAASLYNKTQDIRIEGLGSTTVTLGATLSLTTPPMTLVGSAAYVLEAGVDESNVEFVKSMITCKSWEGI